MKVKSISFYFLVLLLINTAVYSKTLGHFRGWLQIGKNPVVVTKENFKKSAGLQKRTVGGNIRILALVDSRFNPGAVADYGWKYRSRIGSDIVELEGPAQTAPYLTALDGLLYVKMPSRVFSCMDSARKLTCLDEVQNGVSGLLPQSYNGKGVLVGIIETEFDTRHPAFLDSAGNTRFVAIWDQSNTNYSWNRYGYGVIKNHKQIEADSNFALNGAEVHGTWVTGIAAGSILSSNPYYGAAPSASLIGVRYTGSDNDLIDGIDWIFSIADSLHMPCVINMSIGSQEGPHDGTSLMDKAIDTKSGNGKIIVGAAGNDGDKQVHLRMVVKKNDSMGTWVTPIIENDNSNGTNKELSIRGVDIWGISGVYFTVNLIILDTSNMQYSRVQSSISTNVTKQFFDTLYWTDPSGGTADTLKCQILTERSSALNKKVHFEMVVQGSNPNLFLGINVTNPTQTIDTIDAWNIAKRSFQSFGIGGYYDGDSIMSMDEVGGTAKRNISVGAYLSKPQVVQWDGSIHGVAHPEHDMTGYSSHGPTADGRMKPDITAPGSEVVGPLSRIGPDENIVIWPDHQSMYGRYSFSGGTSLAAPIVTGIVALMLEIKPTLSPEEAKSVLQQSAIKDQNTAAQPQNHWGAGKVNAFGAVQKLLGLTGSNYTFKKERKDPVLTVLNRVVKVSGCGPGNGKSFWYSINGRLIAEQTVGIGGVIDIPSHSAGQIQILKLQIGKLNKSIPIVTR